MIKILLWALVHLPLPLLSLESEGAGQTGTNHVAVGPGSDDVVSGAVVSLVMLTVPLIQEVSCFIGH